MQTSFASFSLQAEYRIIWAHGPQTILIIRLRIEPMMCPTAHSVHLPREQATYSPRSRILIV
jgi:hypothetical protein